MARHAFGLVGILLAASVGSSAAAAPPPFELEGRASPPAPLALLPARANQSAIAHRRPGTVIRLAEMDFEARVAEVQRMLRRHGLDPGPVDGKLGVRTLDAIRAYQSLAGAKGAPLPGPAAALARTKGPPPAHGTPAQAD